MLATSLESGLLWAWWGSLGAGILIVLAVVALLHTLLTLVHDIQEELERVWAGGKELAHKTATTWMLDETGRLVDALSEELRDHEALAGERGGR